MSVWIAIPDVDIANPNTNSAGSAAHRRSVATTAIAASAVASELPSVTRIMPDEWARWPSQTPPRMAPPPIVEAMMARPPAPALNTSAANPGSSSLSGRPPTPSAISSTSSAAMPGCVAV